MNVKEAAAALDVSPRRVVAMIAAGQITATKAAGCWHITEVPSVRSRRRPLSGRSQSLLAQALHTRSLAGVHGQELSRTAARIRELRSSENPAELLVDWWRGNVDIAPVNFGTNLVRHAVVGDAEYVREALHRPRREYLRRPEDLAEVVGTERRIRGLSLQQLAREAEVSVADVRAIENGRPLSSPTISRRVLRVLEIEPTALPDLALA
jgi:DNA-binding XRE family transcriptional regulator